MRSREILFGLFLSLSMTVSAQTDTLSIPPVIACHPIPVLLPILKLCIAYLSINRNFVHRLK